MSRRSTRAIASTRSCRWRSPSGASSEPASASLRRSSSATSACPAAVRVTAADAAVLRVRRDRDQALGLEPAQQPAEIAGVEVQARAQRTHVGAVADLPQHPRRSQRPPAREKRVLERADALRDRAVERADLRNAIHISDFSQRSAAGTSSSSVGAPTSSIAVSDEVGRAAQVDRRRADLAHHLERGVARERARAQRVRVRADDLVGAVVGGGERPHRASEFAHGLGERVRRRLARAQPAHGVTREHARVADRVVDLREAARVAVERGQDGTPPRRDLRGLAAQRDRLRRTRRARVERARLVQRRAGRGRVAGARSPPPAAPARGPARRAPPARRGPRAAPGRPGTAATTRRAPRRRRSGPRGCG